MNSLELRSLAKEINDAQEVINALEIQTKDKARDFISEVILQGQRLIRAKACLKHGEWMDYLSAHCPKLSYEQANRYVKVSANLSRVTNLREVSSLREALALCDAPVERKHDDDEESECVQKWPNYIDCIGIAQRFKARFERTPIAEWPEEGKDKLREELRPVVQILWPEFSGPSHDKN